MNTITSVILVGLFAFALPTPSFATDPRDQSCGLINALVNGGAAGVLEYTKSTLAAHWGEEDQNKLVEPMLQQFAIHEFVGGSAFLIADLGDDMQEHLLTLKLDGFGTFYGRIIYEKLGKDSFGMRSIMFEDDFPQVSVRPYLQKPVPLPCD